jgi:hypothetical protein
MKISVFWVIILCSPMKVIRRFRGTCRLHLRAGRVSEATYQLETLVEFHCTACAWHYNLEETTLQVISSLLSHCFFARLILLP